MSNRICFISKDNTDISNINYPEFIGGGQEFCSPRYEPERKCIFTYIKTCELYGDREYGILPDRNWITQVKEWAEENNLIITSDYELDRNKS
jgi:hypothetical protein